VEPNYSLDGLSDRAEAARTALGFVVDERLKAYAKRRAGMAKEGIPILCVVGFGRAGKDTAADYLGPTFHLARGPSSSLTCLPFVTHMVYGKVTFEQTVYDERHSRREFWLHACNALREKDPTLLAKMCLALGEMVVGIRGKPEFDAVVKDGVVDLTLWVDNTRVPPDFTVEFAREDCDVVVDNHTTLDQFHRRLARLGRVLYGRRAKG
jgi:hypothetical protein